MPPLHPGRGAGDSRWLFAVLLCILAVPGSAVAQSWTFHGTVAEGEQVDAVRGPNATIHLLTNRYYQFDAAGSKLIDEAVGDAQQCMLCFAPAIAVGDDGTVHIVTRHDGDMGTGFDIRYRRRSAAGNWDADYLFGGRVGRNYVVGVAWGGFGQVFLSSSQNYDNVWGDLHIWQAGDSSATKLGTVDGVWRADCDARMRGQAGHVFMSSGKPDGNGHAAYYLYGNPDTGVANQLNSSVQTHTAGSDRTGFADIYPDQTHTLHFTYGGYQAVYYNKYAAGGARQFGSDQQLFAGLNGWHLNPGLSAVAASDDGSIVVAAGLRTDGSKVAGNCDLLWNYSTDGGATWRGEQDTGRQTTGGEGRQRPRIIAIGNKFLMFYRDLSNGGISLATLEFVVDADNDSYDSTVDCDDNNAAIHPGAVELCNGVNDDCDDSTDEGCTSDAGTGGADGSSAGTADAADVGDAAVGGGSGTTSATGDLRGSCGCRAASARGQLGGLLILLAVAGTLRRRRS